MQKVSDAKQRALEPDSESESEEEDDEDEFHISFQDKSDEEQFDNELDSDEELIGNNVFDLEDDEDYAQGSDNDQGFESDNDLSRLEDVQEVISDTTSAFDKVVKHIMAKQGYQGQSTSTDKPSKLLAPAARSVPLARFPRSNYVTKKLQLRRDALKHNPVSSSASGKNLIQKFFKPPAFLSRVSEVGDPVRNTESVKTVVKSFSSTPEEWNDILSELKVADSKSLGKGFLAIK